MSAIHVKKLKEGNPEKFANLGKSWTDEEVVQLLREIQKNLTHAEIAEIHKRSTGSILSRLKSIAADYHFNDNRPIEQIMKYTGLSERGVQEAIVKRQRKGSQVADPPTLVASAPAHAVPSSLGQSPAASASAPPQPKGLTKEDFYNTMFELLTVAKDIQRMMKDFYADTFVSK
jgi:hypothetical protein